MTYNEFKQNFLGEFLKIKSYAGKIKYANEHLTRIGSGTGRVVFDIDGEKVLKLAKNPKGIAQNEAEAGAGRYPDTHSIVTEVFEEADNDEWLISEKAKKVNEKRIKDITGIPSLNDVYYFLRNNYEQNKGKRAVFGQEPEIVEFLTENEFVQELDNFIANYNQSPGDMGRPSTYGEVLRDGQPTIVLTDYGLNDEVYDTHYNPERKQRYRMYELYNFADGNDDILSDMPPQDGVDTRHAMWGLMPYGVGDGDGDGVVNEGFISFVMNRDKYPTRPLPSTPYIVDEFHNIVNNLQEVLNKVGDKKKFYNNLLELQNYLIRGKFYDRDPLEKQIVNLDEVRNNPLVPVEKLETEQSDKLASKLARKLNLGTPQPINEGGANGRAYMLSGNRVLKITVDVCEVNAAVKTKSGKPKTLVNAYAIYKIQDREKNIEVYAIIMDFVPEKPEDEFKRLTDITLETIQPNLYVDLLGTIMKQKGRGVFVGRTFEEFPELAQTILTANPAANITQMDRQKAYQFMLGLYEIKKDLIRLEITSNDFMTLSNLGYKDGVLIYFDIGGCGGDEPNLPDNAIIALDEDGSALYSTDNSFGQDNFPTYNNDDTSPSISNDLNANSALYEEINDEVPEYHIDFPEKYKSLNLYNLHSDYGSASGAIHNVTNWVTMEILDDKEMYIEFLNADEIGKGQGKIVVLQVIDYAKKHNIKYVGSASLNEFSRKTFENLEKEGIVKPFLNGLHGKTITWEILNGGLNEDLEYNHVAGDATQDEFQLTERVKSYMPNSSTVDVKKKCRLGGNGSTSTACNQGDIGNLNIKSLNEEIDASEAYTDEGALNSMVRGKKDIAIIMLKSYPHLREIAVENDFGFIPIKQTNHNLGMSIIYRKTPRGETNAKKLEKIMISHGGYVSDKTPGEAYKIGKLLDYTDESILKYVNRIYKKTVNGQIVRRTLPELRQYDTEHPRQDLNESIHKHIVRNPEDSLKAILSGRKDIDFINVNKKFADKIEKNKIGIIPVRMTSQNSIMSIVYTNKEKALKLYEFLKSHGMHLTDNNAEEAREIGELMGYKQENIEAYIQDKYGDVNEGVGDKYFEKLTGKPDEFSDFTTTYAKEQNKEDIVYSKPYDDLVIIRNPKSWENIKAWVRGVIDEEGNLYVEQRPVRIHDEILERLNDLGLITYIKDWDAKIPTNFVTVQRYAMDDVMLIGESNAAMRDDEERASISWNQEYWSKIPSKKDAAPVYQRFLDKAKSKNPQIRFINEHLRDYNDNKQLDKEAYPKTVDNVNENINEAKEMMNYE